jgi:hypothetical protein
VDGVAQQDPEKDGFEHARGNLGEVQGRSITNSVAGLGLQDVEHQLGWPSNWSAW